MLDSWKRSREGFRERFEQHAHCEIEMIQVCEGRQILDKTQVEVSEC